MASFAILRLVSPAFSSSPYISANASVNFRSLSPSQCYSVIPRPQPSIDLLDRGVISQASARLKELFDLRAPLVQEAVHVGNSLPASFQIRLCQDLLSHLLIVFFRLGLNFFLSLGYGVLQLQVLPQLSETVSQWNPSQ